MKNLHLNAEFSLLCQCSAFRYDCPDFRELDRTKCHLSGKTYAVGEEISAQLPTCTSACSCDGAEDEFGFSCKFDECAESKEPPKKECAYQFTIDSCCATNIVCDKAEIDKLPRCWNDGHEFVKGNLIYSPHAPCYKCICDEKFSNKTDASQNPNCKPVECGVELHQLSYLQLGCIPVYFNDGLCCPFEFKCRKFGFELIPMCVPIVQCFHSIFCCCRLIWAARDGEEVVAGNGSKSEHTCKYGKMTMNIGDKIKTNDPCLECFCDTPPMARCIRTITTEQCH